MAKRSLKALFVLAPFLVLGGGSARADEAVSFGPGLRPFLHTDRMGNTLVDVCPERVKGGRRCFSQRRVRPDSPKITPNSGGTCTAMGGGGYSGPPSGTLGPTGILAAYNIPSSAHANGAIVALVELPSTHALNDVNTYRSAYGLSTLSTCPTNAQGYPDPGGTACFARVGPDGKESSVGTIDCPGWSGETGLDMDMVSAACPDCSIVVIEAPTDPDLDAMNTTAVTIGAAAVSNSWGAPEYAGFDDDTPYSSPSIAIFAASGDAAYLNEDEGANTTNFPASSPHVVAVGGTTLMSGSYDNVVWDDDAMGGGGAGGSGCSTEWPMPSYQSGSGMSFAPCTKRASVDLSAAAEYYAGGGGGIAAYDYDDNGWNVVVGTSAASPMVAAIMVRVGLAGKDNHTLFYSNPSAFTDVTSGKNGSCGNLMCTAGVGYDGPTGLGTPNGASLFALAGGVSPPPPDGGPPPGDSGSGDSGGGGDAGGPPPADGGSGPPPGSVGAPCTGPTSCNDPNVNACVNDPNTGKDVCAPSCDGATPCPLNFTCSGSGAAGGYCFQTPPSTKDPGGFKDRNNSGGCGCSTVGGSAPWGGVGALALGFLAFVRRRRRA